MYRFNIWIFREKVMRGTHNSQCIPIIFQFYDSLNQVNIISHYRKYKAISSESLTYDLNPCLDNVRLKSEIKCLFSRKYSWVCRRNPIVWRRITLEDPRWFRTWKYHLFPGWCSLDSACPIKSKIIKFKCHNIQSTDSDLVPFQPWRILNSEERKPKISRIL